MVKITDGRTTLTVTSGAFRDIYSNQGYKLVNEIHSTPVEQTETPAEVSPLSGDKLIRDEVKNTTEAISVQETGVINPEPEDLSEIPLAEMTNDQLKAYAKQLGINLKGITSRKAVRDKIRAAL